MQFYDIKIAPNGVRQIDVQGDYVYFLEGSAGGADVTIRLRNQTGADAILLRPGQAYKTGVGGYTKWIIENDKGEGTIVGKLLMGEGAFYDNRISGSVEVIDGGKARTMSGAACIGLFGAPQGAGQYSSTQLWNPPGSGKLLVLEQVICVSGVSTGFVHAKTNAPLSGAGAQLVKKNFADPTSPTGIARVQASAAPPTNLGGVILINSPVNVSSIFRPIEPIVIPPGYGYCIYGQNLNADLTTSYEWYEESIS